jgi:GNAT superfamily N-acetyltransferase
MPGPGPRIRAATAADVEEVARIWHEGWGDGHRGHVADELLQHRRADTFVPRTAERLGTTWVAEVDHTVAGFVVLSDDEVEQIYVDRSMRGTDVASSLLDFAEEHIAAGHDHAWLAVVEGNARARRFYERRGWYDDGGFDYEAQAAEGTVRVPSRRYRKRLAPPG